MNPVDIDLPLAIIPNTRPRNPRFKQLHTVIEMGAATSYMGELVQMKNNLFLHDMQYLQIVLTVGYYALLIPFRISVDDNGYKLVSNPLQWGLSSTLLFISTCVQLLVTKSMWARSDLKNYPEVAVLTYEKALMVILMITFLYTCIYKRNRFMQMFEKFNTSCFSRATSAKTKKRYNVILCGFLYLMAWVNWACWGAQMYNMGLQDTVDSFYNLGFNLELSPCCEKCITCYFGRGIFFLLLELHSQIVKAYVELVLWGVALCLYNIEITAKTYLVPDDTLRFDIKNGTDVFRIINKLVKELCSAMGPITVAYYMQLIPYGVCLVLSYNGNYYHWHQILFLFFKLGHIFLTAESNANASNLVDDIMANRIIHSPENIGMLMILNKVTKKPIALQGMDFFDVTYKFLGSIGIAVMTYCLLVVELAKDRLSPPIDNFAQYPFHENITATLTTAI